MNKRSYEALGSQTVVETVPQPNLRTSVEGMGMLLPPGKRTAPSYPLEMVIPQIKRPSIRQLIETRFEGVSVPLPRDRTIALIAIKKGLPLSRVEDNKVLYGVLRRQLQTESDGDVKFLILQILGDVARQPHIDATEVVSDVLAQLSDKSKKIKCQVFRTVEVIGMAKRIPTQLLVSKTIDYVSNTNHILRKQALLTLAHLCPVTHHISTNLSSTYQPQKVLAEFMADTDSRVRTAAFQGILILHNRGFSLDMDLLYPRAVSALNDDFETVRMEAIKLIWVLSNMHPNQRVTVNKTFGDNTLRLVDDGFMKICNAGLDSSTTVRQLACSLLGCIHNVKTVYLLQTLSKEVLSNRSQDSKSHWTARNAKSARNRSSNPAGDMDVDLEEVVLSDSGAAGAIVHGLEDEYYEVRMAAVDSICELSMRSQHLAARAVEYLVDMFNDEIDAVRINSIESVHKIGSKVQLKEEQLHTVLSILEDASDSVRRAVYHLLSSIKVVNITCLLATIQTLLGNLARYTEDTGHIFKCLAGIGNNHPNFTEFIVDDLLLLLRIDQRFISAEPHTDDVSYIGVMIVFFNAAAGNRSIIALLPEYAMRHHIFFKDKYPHLFPDVALIRPKAMQISELSLQQQKGTDEEDASLLEEGAVPRFLEKATQLMDGINKCIAQQNLEQAEAWIKGCARDLKRVSKIDASLKPKTEFYLIYLLCLKIMLQIKKDERSVSYATAASYLRHTYRLEHQFLGLDFETVLDILQLRVHAHLLLLAADEPTQLQDMQQQVGKGEREVQQLIKRIKLVFNYCTDRDMVPPKQLINLNESLHKLVTPSNTHMSGGNVDSAKLLSLAMNFVPPTIRIQNLLKRSTAEISQPISNPDRPEEVLSTLPYTLHLQATLQNIPNVEDVFIIISFPDQTAQVFPLRRDQFKPCGWGGRISYELACNLPLYMNQQEWMEASYVSIQIAKSFPVEIEGFDEKFAVDPVLLYDWPEEFLKKVPRGIVPLSPNPNRFYIIPKTTRTSKMVIK